MAELVIDTEGLDEELGEGEVVESEEREEESKRVFLSLASFSLSWRDSLEEFMLSNRSLTSFVASSTTISGSSLQQLNLLFLSFDLSSTLQASLRIGEEINCVISFFCVEFIEKSCSVSNGATQGKQRMLFSLSSAMTASAEAAMDMAPNGDSCSSRTKGG